MGKCIRANAERVRAVLAATVAEFDTDDHQAGRGQVVAPVCVRGSRGLEHDHPTAVDVQQARQWPRDLAWAVHEQGDVVAVDASDHFDLRGHALDRGPAHRQRPEQLLETELGHREKLEELVERRIRVDGHG